MGQPVACTRCGSAFMMTVVSNPPPACPNCGGALAALPQQQASMYGGPASASPFDQPSPFGAPASFGPAPGSPLGPTLPAKPAASDGPNVPLIALLCGGAVALVLLLLCGGVFYSRMSSTPPVAALPANNIPANNVQPVYPGSPVNPQPYTPPTTNITPTPYTPPSPVTPPPVVTPTISSPPAFSPPGTHNDEDPFKETGSSTPGGTGKISAPATGLDNTLGGSSFSPRVNWQVEPDPLATPLEFTVPSKPLAVVIEGLRNELIYPSRPSYFVAAAVNDFKNKQIKIYDLRTGRAPTKFPGEIQAWNASQSALSSDGAFMATTLTNPTRVVVANTKTGKLVQNIDFPAGNDVKDVIFLGDTQLLAIVNKGWDDSRAAIYDVAEGKELADFALEIDDGGDRWRKSRYAEGSVAASPGGKYFAVVIGNVLCVHASDDGKLIGELELEGADSNWSYAGLAFSSNGEELAAVVGSDRTILRIDVKKGEILSSAKLAKGEFDQISTHGNGSIAYLPELNCFFLDNALVVEANTGQAIFGLKEFRGKTRVLPGNRIVGKIDGRADGLAEYRLPGAEIGKLAEALRSGGTLYDALLGPAKVGDMTGAEQIYVPASGVEWTVKVPTAMTPVAAKKSIPLPKPYDNFHYQVMPVPSATGSHFAWLPTSRESHSKLFGVDVTTGKLEGQIDAIPRLQAVDISPDGSLVLCAVAQNSWGGYNPWGSNLNTRRLEIYSIPLKKHVLAWKIEAPAETNERHRMPSRFGGSDNVFAEAYFIAKNQVLTRLDNGQVSLWTLPDAKAKYQLHGKMEITGFTPDRQFVLLRDQESQNLRWLEASTGKWSGEWKSAGHNRPALAFSPKGDRIAQVINGNGYTQIRIYDAATGAEQEDFIVPPIWSANNRVSWTDDKYLLVDRVLFDVERGAPAWNYNVTGTPMVTGDGHYWLIEHGQGTVTLTSCEVPSKEVKSKVKHLRPDPIRPIIGPKSRVSVSIGSLAGGVNPQEAQANLERQIASYGWVVDPSGPYKLTASSVESSGDSVTYKGFGRASDETVNIRKVTTTYRITDGAGAEIWKTEFTASQGAPFTVWLKEGESVQGQLNKSFEGTLKGAVSGSGIPAYIFPANPYAKLGSSTLSSKGEQLR